MICIQSINSLLSGTNWWKFKAFCSRDTQRHESGHTAASLSHETTMRSFYLRTLLSHMLKSCQVLSIRLTHLWIMLFTWFLFIISQSPQKTLWQLYQPKTAEALLKSQGRERLECKKAQDKPLMSLCACHVIGLTGVQSKLWRSLEQHTEYPEA